MKKRIIAAAIYALSTDVAVADEVTRYCAAVTLAMARMNAAKLSDDETMALLKPFAGEAKREGDNASSRQCLRFLNEMGIWPEANLTPKRVHMLHLLGNYAEKIPR